MSITLMKGIIARLRRNISNDEEKTPKADLQLLPQGRYSRLGASIRLCPANRRIGTMAFHIQADTLDRSAMRSK